MTDRETANPVPQEDGDEAGARRVAGLISGLLRWGVRASFLLIVLGSVLSFARREHGPAATELARLTGPDGGFPRRADWILSGVVDFRGTPLVVAGLLLLIATPMLRVVVSVAIFAGQRDRTFMLITAGVAALLTLSFVFGSVAR